MTDLDSDQYNDVVDLIAWCIGAAILLVTVGAYGWLVAEAFSAVIFVIAVLIAVLFVLAGGSIWTTAPALFNDEDEARDENL